MEGGGAGNGLTGTAQIKGTGVDGSAKPLPPCCVKARAAAPESEAKCHATVVSGWFTEPRSRCGMSRLCFTPLIILLLLPAIILQSPLVLSDQIPPYYAGKASKVQYYNNPMWPGTCPATANISIFCLPNEYISNNSPQE